MSGCPPEPRSIIKITRAEDAHAWIDFSSRPGVQTIKLSAVENWTRGVKSRGPLRATCDLRGLSATNGFALPCVPRSGSVVVKALSTADPCPRCDLRCDPRRPGRNTITRPKRSSVAVKSLSKAGACPWCGFRCDRRGPFRKAIALPCVPPCRKGAQQGGYMPMVRCDPCGPSEK